ncbi:ABC transporter substrate-binding protein [Humibacter soli]
MRKTRIPRSRKLISVAVAGAMIAGLAACSSGGNNSGDGLILNVASQSDSLTQTFNPYLPNTAQGATFAGQGSGGFIYEPLVQINNVKIGDDIPWLAKSWTWSDENKKLTLDLQKGVKWTDGKPFSADDVVFTYNMLKKFPALNVGGIDFDTVTAPDANTVVMTFKQPSEINFTSIVSAAIVSQHIWSKVKDPTKYADKNPVGTGPFELSTFSPQSFVLKANKNYWQTPPKIGGLRFIPYKDNQGQTNALVQGQADWGGTYIADATKTYTSKSSDNHYWAPVVGQDGLIPNLEKWPLSDIAVRRAISLGVDRSQVGAATDSPPATNQTGLPMPAFMPEVAPQYKDLNFKYDKSAAEKQLTDAGYSKGSDGYYQKDGKRVEFSVSFPASYTDIAARAQVLVSQLKDIGIKLDIDTTSVNDINKITADGSFQSTIGYPVGPAPRAFNIYQAMMDPNQYYPIGQSTPTFENIERFNDPTAKKLFNEYPLATTDAERSKIMAQLEGIWIDQLPMIVMFYWGNYGDWSTAKVTGFPTPSNPYFAPYPNPVVALKLTPTSK